MANASEPVIRVEGVQKSFGANHVLRGVDFEVMPGEVVTIIGASGSGKSTLLRCINLLETPTPATCGSTARIWPPSTSTSTACASPSAWCSRASTSSTT